MEVIGHSEGLQYAVANRSGSSREISHSPLSCPEYNVVLDLTLPHSGVWGTLVKNKDQNHTQSPAHRMSRCFRWVLRAWVTTSGE